MNYDDPNLTAYALGELPPEEAAAMEQLLRDDPAAAAEVEEIRALCGRLKGELAGEEALDLSEERRVALLRSNVEAFAKPKRRPVWVPWALAASVALVLSGGAWWQQNQGRRKELAASQPRLPVLDSVGRTNAFVHRESTSGAEAAAPLVAINEPRPVALAPVDGGALVAEEPAPQVPPAAAPAPMLAEADVQLATKSLRPLTNELTSQVTSVPLTISSATPSVQASTIEPSNDKLVASSGSGRTALPGAYGAALAKDAPHKAEASGYSGATGAERSALLGKWSSDQLEAAKSPDAMQLALSQAEKDADVARQKVGSPQVVAAALNSADRRAQEDQAGPMRGRFGGKARDQSPLVHTATLRDEIEVPSERSTYEPYPGSPAVNEEKYAPIVENDFVNVSEQPRSTFSIDVDTASYTNVRRFLQNGQRPPRDAVKIEELLNYFRYDYPAAAKDLPCSVNLEAADCPWAPEHRLVRVGLKAKTIAPAMRPVANLVFLLDISGSMSPENRLPLALQSLRLLTDQLGPEDRVSIVFYANSSGIALEPTSDKTKVREALAQLHASGGTNGGAGIQTAYELAKQNFQPGQINRVILCTDGDFNVGVTSRSELIQMISEKAKSGVFLTVLGFGYGNLKDATLEKLADRGNGNYAYIDNLTEGRRVLVEQLGGTLVNVAKDVKVQIEFNPAQVGAYRLIGYEKRHLRNEDFKNDRVDAGELGSGQTVTALYEIVPPGAPGTPSAEDLKYQPVITQTPKPAAAVVEGASKEMLTLQIRWKTPEGDKSSVHEFPFTASDAKWQGASSDFRWAAAVASFGMLLRDSPHAGTASWGTTRELARGAKGEDANGYRQEFLSLIDQAEAASR